MQSSVCANPKVLRCHLPIHSAIGLEYRLLMNTLRDRLDEICTTLAVGDLSVCVSELWVSKKMPWSSGMSVLCPDVRRSAAVTISRSLNRNRARGIGGAPKMGAILCHAGQAGEPWYLLLDG